jgi:hypothetical protein
MKGRMSKMFFALLQSAAGALQLAYVVIELFNVILGLFGSRPFCIRSCSFGLLSASRRCCGRPPDTFDK